MPFNGQMDKENVVFTYNGILLSTKKEGNSIIFKTWMDLEDIY